MSGALTTTGKPFVANDPHRIVALPSLRYMIHLVAPGWNVIGAGEPGLPGVALGHNEHIAWGFTIFGLDQQDLYIEELNPANPLEYRTDTGWRAMTTRHEIVKVRGAAAQDVVLKFTRHGPVLWSDEHRALALHWVGTEPGTAGYLASLSIDRAQNWEQFEAAVPRWKVPSENLVYGDTAGNIGEHSAGLAPIRRWTGLLPVPGNGQYEWTGFVPSERLPHSFNPKAGFVATANDRKTPDHYPFNVGFEWDEGYRVARIEAVLSKARDGGRKLALTDMADLQADVTSLPALEFQSIVRATPLAADATLAGFLRWDGRLTRESADAALYEVWFRAISKDVAARVSKEHGGQHADLSPKTVLRMLSQPGPDAFGADAGAARNTMLATTLAAARHDLERLEGADASKWAWGTLHVMQYRHALDRLTDTARLLDPAPVARPRR